MKHLELPSAFIYLLSLTCLITAPSARQLGNQIDEDVSLNWQSQIATSVNALDDCLALDTVGDRVFTLTGGSFPNPGSADAPFALMALDAVDGSSIWSTIEVASVPALMPVDMVASPDGAGVFVAGKFNQFSTVSKYDATTGALIWGVLVPLPANKNESIAGLAVSFDSTRVVVGLTRIEFLPGNNLQEVVTACLDTSNGALLWADVFNDPAKVSQGAGFVSVDAVAGRVHTSHFAQTAGFEGRVVTRGLNLANGSTVWSDEFAGTSGVSAGALHGDDASGRVFVAVQGSGGDNELLAYDSTNGTALWNVPTSARGRHIAVQPGGAQVAVAGFDFAHPVIEGFVATTGALAWAGSIDTGLAFTLYHSRGIDYTPDGANVLVGLDGDYLASGATEEQALVAAMFETTNGAEVWLNVEDQTAVTGGVICNSTIAATTSGPRLQLISEVNTGLTVNLRLMSIEPPLGTVSWEETVSSLAPTGVDVLTDVVLSADASTAFAVGAEAKVGDSFSTVHARAVDADTGAELWLTQLADFAGNRWRVLVSPLGDVVYVGNFGLSEFAAAALDASTGAILWQRDWNHPTGRVSSRSMALSPDGSQLFFAGEATFQDRMTLDDFDRATMYALDTSTGAEFWSDTYFSNVDEDATGWDCVVSPDGTRVMMTGETDDELFVRSYNTTTGIADWTTLFDFSVAFGGSPAGDVGKTIQVSPDGTIVFVSGLASSIEFGGTSLEEISLALNAATGAQLWFAPDSVPELAGTQSFTQAATLATDGSTLFLSALTQTPGFFDNRFRTRALDANTGIELWEHFTDSIDGAEINDLELSPDGERLYVSGEVSEFSFPSSFDQGQRVIAYDTDTGAQYWSVDRTGDTNFVSSAGGLAIGDDFVLASGMSNLEITGNDGFLTRYDERPMLTAPPLISLTGGGTQELQLNATSNSAGEIYLVLGSFSGTTPGLLVQGQVLPLQPDPYFRYTIHNSNSGGLVNTLGFLDGNGRAGASIVFPAGLDPALAGLVFHHAFLSLDPNINVTSISNASSLLMVP